MLNNVKLCGYDVPTPIQSYVLPAVFMDQDIIGIAQTGMSIRQFHLSQDLMLCRLWEDGRLSHSSHLKTHGQSTEAWGVAPFRQRHLDS